MMRQVSHMARNVAAAPILLLAVVVLASAGVVAVLLGRLAGWITPSPDAIEAAVDDDDNDDVEAQAEPELIEAPYFGAAWQIHDRTAGV